MIKPKPYTVYIIAGEPSGDLLGGRLMAALTSLASTNTSITYGGIGGDKMLEQGLNSLFPMAELSIMGVAEVVPKLPKLISRIRQTAEDIKRLKPDVVITIDAPDFCFRVVKKVRKLGIPLVHMVAPSVWAWRESRALKTAKLVDHLLTLLPFEPPYFEKYGLDSTFIGHPVLESGADQGLAQRFRETHNVTPNQKLLTVLPGSRAGEILKLLPIFKETIAALAGDSGNLITVMPIAQGRQSLLKPFIENWPTPLICIDNDDDKFDAFAATDVALAASGTVSLELAMAGTPSIIAYRLNAITYWLAKKLIRVKYANLVNILLGEAAIPEFLQNACTAKNLKPSLLELLNDPGKCQQQKLKYKKALSYLGGDEQRPSHRAAIKILSILQKKGRP